MGLAAGWWPGAWPWAATASPRLGDLAQEPRRRGDRARKAGLLGAGGGAGAPNAGSLRDFRHGTRKGRAAAGGSCSPAVVGGPAAHARCIEACFTSVTTGELGFNSPPFVPPPRGASRGRGWSARAVRSGPTAGLAEWGGEAGGPGEQAGHLGLPGKPAGPSLEQPGLGLPLPWSRGGGGANRSARAGLVARGTAGGRGRSRSIGATTPPPRGCSVSPRQGLEEAPGVPGTFVCPVPPGPFVQKRA